MLIQSEMIFEDTSFYRSDVEMGGRLNEFLDVEKPPMLLHCIPWKNIEPSRELRCFIFEKQLVAITQYDLYKPFGFLEENLFDVALYVNKLVSNIQDVLPYENCVLDVEVTLSQHSKNGIPGVWIIEFNPYSKISDGVLFHTEWDVNNSVLFQNQEHILIRFRPTLSKGFSEIQINRSTLSI